MKKEDYPDLREIERYYLQARGEFLVAVLGDVIVGTIACDKLGESTYVLKRMFVDRRHRGLGIAQLLLDKLFDRITHRENNQAYSFFLSTKDSHSI